MQSSLFRFLPFCIPTSCMFFIACVLILNPYFIHFRIIIIFYVIVMWCLNAQTDLNLPTSHLCDSALQFTYNITAASVSPGTLWSDLTVQEWYLEQAKEVILIEVSTAQMTWVLFSGRFSSSELYIPLSLRHSCRSLQNRTFQQGTQMQGCQAEIHVIEKGPPAEDQDQ